QAARPPPPPPPPPPLPSAAAREPLPATVSEPLWLAIRGNLTTLADALTWAEIVGGSLAPVLEDPTFLGEAPPRAPAPGAVGRDDVEGVDGRGFGRNPAQGPGAVPSAPARPHGTRDWARDGQAPAPDRPRPSVGAGQPGSGLR